MKNIADEAGVSIMTVSLALRNSPRISSKTRARIVELADELGFKPDPALSALVAYRSSQGSANFTGTIVYLNNSDRASIIDSPGIHQNYYTGALKRGKALGYEVEEFWLNSPGMTEARASNILATRGIQGILVGPQPSAHGSVNLDWDRFTAIRLGHTLDSPKLHTVAANQYLAVNLCFRELCKLGYSRIGLAINLEQDERTENRYTAAYLALQKKLPPELPRLPIFIGEDNCEHFGGWVDQWKPDAIIGPRPSTLTDLEQLGIQPGKDIGFVYPYTTGDASSGFACSGVEQTLIGRAAIDFLNSLLLQNEKGIPDLAYSLMLEPVWEPRETVRRVGPAVPLRML